MLNDRNILIESTETGALNGDKVRIRRLLELSSRARLEPELISTGHDFHDDPRFVSQLPFPLKILFCLQFKLYMEQEAVKVELSTLAGTRYY